MINTMQTITQSRKELNQMQNSSIRFIGGSLHAVNRSKAIFTQLTGSEYKIMENRVYTLAITNCISAMQSNASAIENDTCAIKDSDPACANYNPAFEFDSFAVEKNRSANGNPVPAITDDPSATENYIPAMENDTSAIAKYVFAVFGTNKTSYSTLKSR